MVFLTLFLVPLVVSLTFYYVGKGQITVQEFLLVQLPGQAVVAGVSTLVIYYASVADVEMWNGRVSGKYRDRVSCGHSYSCNCRTSCSGSGTSRSCHTVCDTCYEHLFDYDWVVKTSMGDSILIDRIDRQGVREPPRYTVVRIGEPATSKHQYVNYVKASPDSLFRRTESEANKAQVPAYPDGVYDYYRSSGLYPIDVKIPDRQDWDYALSELNADLGVAKQVNVFVVPVLNKPRSYYIDMERAWLGGKKNDVIVVASVNEQLEYQWVEVMSWAKNPMLKIVIRDELTTQKKLDVWQATPLIKAAISQHYVRREMKDFEYLKSSITPSRGAWILSLLCGFFVAVVLGLVCLHNDVFDGRRSSRSRNRYHW